jgi:uncharacterized RDD family membrane protein YckC
LVATEELSVRGLTGVDVSLQIAGLGTRAYAFLIDWHIRLLAALAWVLLGLALAPWGGPALRAWFLLPAAFIYLFYHPVLEILMRGRTPGKRMAGARIVSLEGSTPTVGALLMRNLFRLVDGLPGLYLLGLGCCMLSAQRVRIGDFAAGTVLVLEEPKAAQSLSLMGALAQAGGLDPDAVALVRSLLDRWREMEPARAVALAREVLGRLDRQLDRVQLQALDAVALRQRLEALLGRR